MNLINKIINKIYRITMNLINTMQFYTDRPEDCIVINSWMNLYKSEPEHYNLGDELNFYLVKELSGKNIINYFNLYVPKLENICCIGSILDSMANSQSIIWGTGAISDKNKIKAIPKKILAVRGPLTRQYMINQGIDCPEVYGDPALLLPLIYKVKCEKKYQVGIIPHYVDLKNKVVNNLIDNTSCKVLLIKMRHYKDWHDVIDQINECDFIVSSSLHGLIIADAYNIPNLWVEFSDKITGNGFKYHDYLSSVGKDVERPVQITMSTILEELIPYKKQWKPIKLDINKLLSVCPFPIRKSLMQ